MFDFVKPDNYASLAQQQNLPGDYFSAAKQYCSTNGGRLAKMGEITSMSASSANSSGHYWAIDDEPSVSETMAFAVSPGYDHAGFYSRDNNFAILCVLE